MIRYHIFETRQQAVLAVARLLVQTILEDPSRAIGLATGSTMKDIYAEAVRLLIAAGASLEDLLTFNLDEWGFLGQPLLPGDDIRSFQGWMAKYFHKNLLPLGFKIENAFFPSSALREHAKLVGGMDLSAYDFKIRNKGGVHKWFVGIGQGSKEFPNCGHLAFMERDHLHGSGWYKKLSYSALLEPETRQNNITYEGCNGDINLVPDTALTVGSRTVLGTKSGIVMSAFGKAKAGALLGACERSPTPLCSASLVQLYERDVDIYMDKEAASLLRWSQREVAS